MRALADPDRRADRPISPTDLLLLEALACDARRPNRALACMLAIPESTCHGRVRQLERSGIIMGYRAAIAYEALGAFQAWIDVTLANDDPRTAALFRDMIIHEDGVVDAFEVDGEAQYRLYVVTADFESWKALRLRLLAREGIVAELKRLLIFRRCVLPGRFPLGPTSAERQKD